MIRRYAILLMAVALTACDKPASGGLPSETFTLGNGPGGLSEDIAGHAAGALAYAAIQKQRKDQSPYAPYAPLLRSNYNELTDDQWVQFCFEQIFERLGFPFSVSPGSGVKFDASTYSYVVTHSSEALAAYQAFLDDNNRSPAERFDDLLHGEKQQAQVQERSATGEAK